LLWNVGTGAPAIGERAVEKELEGCGWLTLVLDYD
jgi:hypothetical protein